MTGLFLTNAENPITERAIKVGIVGSGYRARTMLRVMAALPLWFEVVGVAARNAGDRKQLADMGFSAYTTVEHLVKHGRPDFVVSTLHADAAQPIIAELAALGMPALVETPAAGTVDQLTALWRLSQNGACIQVAEQYHLEPLVAAQIAVANSEMLGDVTDAYVSVAHDYHGLSVMRRALGVTFEEPLVTARRDARRVFPSPTRYRDPDGIGLVDTVRTQAWFDYDGASGVSDGPKLGIYDFDDAQYRSWVRIPSLVLRGPLGELRDDMVRMVSIDETRLSNDAAPERHFGPDPQSLPSVAPVNSVIPARGVRHDPESLTSAQPTDAVSPARGAEPTRVGLAPHSRPHRRVAPVATPVSAHLERVAAGGAGSHEGLFLRGYQVFGESAYYNPFLPARLADDEIAIAEMLALMGAHVLAGAPGPYSVAEAAQDQYLAIVMREAATTGEPIRATKQPWAA